MTDKVTIPENNRAGEITITLAQVLALRERFLRDTGLAAETLPPDRILEQHRTNMR